MANRDYTITAPDGTDLTITGPDNATPQQLRAAAEAAFKARGPVKTDQAPVDDIPKMLPRQRATALAGMPQGAMHPGDLAAGLLRGAGSIGATLLTPYDLAVGNTKSIGNPERRAAMDEALQSAGADPNSFAYKAGKVGGEIAGTAGVGPALAPVARVVSPALGQAVRTAGMTTGVAPATIGAKAADLGVRAAGGGVAGAGSAALVDPQNAAAGGVIGAVTPPAIKTVGTVARAAGKAVGMTGSELANVMRSEPTRAAREIMDALEITPEQLPAVVAKLRGAKTLVDGSTPTVAQALAMPQASILERVVSAGPGGERLRAALQAQAEARMAALEGVAPVDPTGYAMARTNLGQAVEKFAAPARAAARARTSELYGQIPQDEAMLYLPELGPIRDKYFGPGVFGQRGAVDAAVDTGTKLGTQELPAILPTKSGKEESLLDFVKRNGGLNEAHPSTRQFAGEVRDLRQSGLGRVVNRSAGQSLDRMTERAYEAGFIPHEDPALLLDALRTDARGTFSAGANRDRQFAAMRDAATGSGQGVPAEVIPRKVSLKDFEDLRKSIGAAQRAAQADPARAAEAKALGDMRQAMDDRIDEVVRGDGGIDENLPLDWADKLTAARASKRAEVERFATGPQAGMWRKGSDGQPQIQGGEVASKFWGNRPGLAEDVQAFRRLIDDNPALLGQFRSMITTEGANTAGQGSTVLGDKFAKWVRSSMPGLREAFDPAQVGVLSRIAEDVNRANAAAQLGKGVGSNTYQNASNALNAGLLGSPFAASIAQRTPFVGRVLDGLRANLAENASKAKATRLAQVLADSQAAADALQSQQLSPASAAIQNLMDMGPRAWTTPISAIGMSLQDMARAGMYRTPAVAFTSDR